jgi:hypothetical protein
MTNKVRAIESLKPGVSFSFDYDKGIIEWPNDVTKPTDSEIDAEVIRLQAEFDALAYSRARQKEYPDWGTQLNKIYDDGLTKWKTEMVDPIKAKFPKP